jgi:hypothetical protein
LLYWEYNVTFTKVLTIYHSWIHLSIIPLYSPSTILRIVSTGLIFPFSYMSTLYFHHIHSPTPFSLCLPLLSLVPTTRQDLFYFLSSVLEKKTFLSVWDSYIWSFIMTFPSMYILYSELVHPFHFSLFYLSPLLMVISASLKILYLFLYRKYINHIYLLNFLLLLSLSC